jgi:hydrogenase large subunit
MATTSTLGAKCPTKPSAVGFHEAVRGVLSHRVVIRDPPAPRNASPRDVNGTLGPYDDAVQNTPIFEERFPGRCRPDDD